MGVGEGGEKQNKQGLETEKRSKPLLTLLTECPSEPLNAHRKKVKHVRPRKRSKPLLTLLTKCPSEPLNAHRKKVKHVRPSKRRSRKRA